MDGMYESKEFDEENLTNSPTIRKLALLGNMLPINISNPDEVKAALAPSFVRLIDTVDAGTIQFKNNTDEKAFLQIMLVCHQLLTQMLPASGTKH